MKRLLLLAIRGYRRFLSPYKGFSCAYRVRTGRASCSELGERAIRMLGVLHGIPVLRRRLARCGAAHRARAAAPPVSRQAGFCDLSCDLPCDADCGGSACDLLSGCGPCDLGDWGSSRGERKRRRKQ